MTPCLQIFSRSLRLTSLFVFFSLVFTWTASADSITKIAFSHSSPSYLAHGQDLTITFDYSTTEAGGVRIFARPFTDGALTPDYGAHGSALYPAGTGSGTGFFTIGSGNVEVDQIRFQMFNADQTLLLMEFFIDVSYFYGEHAINNIQLTPGALASLKNGDSVDITFDYSTTEAGGVRIFARPFTGGSLSPDYGAHGSPNHPAGDGNGTGSFTISTGSVTVDQVRFQMLNDDQSVVLLEFFVDATYLFGEHAISNIQVLPASGGALDNGEQINITFDYSTTEAGGVRIFARPFTDGSLSPDYGAHGSPNYPVGDGNGTGSFTISSGSTVVDEIRFQMFNDDQSSTLLSFFIPVHYLFSAHRVYNIAFDQGSPGYLTLDEQIDFSFDYSTTEAGGVRIFGRPFTEGALTPNYGAHGSPLHPTGDGSGSGSFTISTNPATVDQVRFTMLNDDQSVTFLEYFVPVEYHFINPSSGVANEDETGLPTAYALDQNFPNPFNPATTIPFEMPEAGRVKLAVYDVLGREVRVLVDDVRAPGRYEAAFQAGDLPSGMYLYTLEAGATKLTKALILLK